MKTITIKNLVIQFDGKGDKPVDEAIIVIDLINTVLNNTNLECSPQILTSAIDAYDVEVETDLEQ